MMSTPIVIAAPQYYAQEVTGNLNVITPYGTRLFLGDIGFDKLASYKIEIPLEDLKFLGGDGSEGDQGDRKRRGSSKGLVANIETLVVQANELYNQGKFQEALSSVDEILRQDPEYVRAHVMRGSLMHVLGEKELAKKSWNKALEIEPNNEELKKLIQSEGTP